MQEYICKITIKNKTLVYITYNVHILIISAVIYIQHNYVIYNLPMSCNPLIQYI